MLLYSAGVINSIFSPVVPYEEVEISLVPSPSPVGEEGTHLQELVFLCQEWRK